ncbi:MAG: histone deacetylase [Thermodesulfovibrionales bacterium]
MRSVGLIYDDVFLKHETPDWHPESRERLVSIMNSLRSSEIWDALIHIKPRLASYEDIGLVHTPEYIERVRSFGKGYLDPDTYMSEGSLEAALFAAGAVMEAVDRCRRGEIERAFCAVRPPGHHAEANRAMGFCIFNNVAIGARYARSLGYRKVFIVDFDVHHGNGTQHIFEEDDTVFYFSTHQYPHYPGTGDLKERGKGRGEGYTANFPMAAGAGDKEYFAVYHDILPGLVHNFGPDIILVSAGYDMHRADPLAQISVSEEGIRNIVRNIVSSAPVPAIFALEGGYDLEALGRAVLITVRNLQRD